MMEKLSRWVLGTATARVTGDTARFLNILVRSGISPLAMHREEDALLLTVRAKQYKKLHGVKRRTGARVRLVRRGGGPFLLRRSLKRPGLLVGMAVGIGLFQWLSGFYWCVSVEGDVPYAASEIWQAAAESGVYIGASRKNTDLPTSANQLIRKLPRLAWASFNSEGCAVTLHMRPALERAAGSDHEGAYDVVAAQSGMITKITAPAGTVLVQVGSAVEAGQVLVSGVTVIGDPWDPEQPVRHLLSHARAEILAETRHTFTASCPLQMKSYRETEIGVRRALYVLGLRVPLSLSGAPPGEVTVLERKPLTLLGVTLPVWVETQRIAEKTPITVEYTEEEAKQRAAEAVRQLQENYLHSRGRILSEEMEFTLRDGVVYAAAHCVVEEDIAKEVSMYGG